MTTKRISISPRIWISPTARHVTDREARRLAALVRELPTAPAGAHLTRDEFPAYACGMLSPSDVARADEHLASCEECAKAMDYVLMEDARDDEAVPQKEKAAPPSFFHFPWRSLAWGIGLPAPAQSALSAGVPCFSVLPTQSISLKRASRFLAALAIEAVLAVALTLAVHPPAVNQPQREPIDFSTVKISLALPLPPKVALQPKPKPNQGVAKVVPKGDHRHFSPPPPSAEPDTAPAIAEAPPPLTASSERALQVSPAGVQLPPFTRPPLLATRVGRQDATKSADPGHAAEGLLPSPRSAPVPRGDEGGGLGKFIPGPHPPAPYGSGGPGTGPATLLPEPRAALHSGQSAPAERQEVLIISKPRPQYTACAIRSHLEGHVRVRALFSKSGVVTETAIVGPALGCGLDESAQEAIRRIKFEPARLNNQAVDAYVVLVADFDLTHQTSFLK